MDQVDGCPSCVLNGEPPLCEVPVENGVRCAYMCTDCGHYWTTDWAADALVSRGIPGAAEGRMTTQSGPESARTDRGLADWIGVDR